MSVIIIYSLLLVLLFVVPMLIALVIRRRLDSESEMPSPDVIEANLRKGFLLQSWAMQIFVCGLGVVFTVFFCSAQRFGFELSIVYSIVALCFVLAVTVAFALIGRTLIYCQYRRLLFHKGRSKTDKELYIKECLHSWFGSDDTIIYGHNTSESRRVDKTVSVLKRELLADVSFGIKILPRYFAVAICIIILVSSSVI